MKYQAAAIFCVLTVAVGILAGIGGITLIESMRRSSTSYRFAVKETDPSGLRAWTLSMTTQQWEAIHRGTTEAATQTLTKLVETALARYPNCHQPMVQPVESKDSVILYGYCDRSSLELASHSFL